MSEEEIKKREESLHTKIVLGREQDEDKRETERDNINEVMVDFNKYTLMKGITAMLLEDRKH